MKSTLSLLALLSAFPAALGANFSLVQDYSGTNFFNGWDFYGNYDNLTNGDVIWVNQTNATNLAYVNSAGQAIIKVDNTSFVPYNEKRDSVRITTKDYFNVGSVIIIDVAHLPYGCSVWPAFWTKGNDWPNNGEIDIIEGVNQMTYNQMALHAGTGCVAATGTDQTGSAGGTNCTDGAGCTVVETKPNSYGAGFAAAGGGVWATQFDVTGIYIWFWSRANIPASVTTATDSLDISTWGPPSAAYPASACNIPSFFGAQQLVLDITLCGDWAGVASVYQATCGGNGQADQCYINNVINNGTSDYANAYFEINYVRAFSVNGTAIVDPSGSPLPTGSNPTGSGSAPGSTASPSGGSSSGTVVSPGSVYVAMVSAGVLSLVSWMML